MRARSIKPGFYKNEELSECSPFARLLFPGLWMLADREGKLEYRPKRIKAEVFPFDPVDVAGLVLELESHGLVKTYSVSGVAYLWVVKFLEHQKPHQNEVSSTIPNYSNMDEALATKVQSTCDQGNKHFALDPSSLNPYSHIPDKGTPYPPDGGTCPEKPKREKKPVGSLPFAEAFADFWSAYPRKTAKANAEKAWAKLVKANALPDMDTLLAAVENQTRVNDWARENFQYCPHPATWLNGRRWEDTPGIAKDAPTADSRKYRSWAESYATKRAALMGEPSEESPDVLDAGAKVLAEYITPDGFSEDEAGRIIAWLLSRPERAAHVSALANLTDEVPGWGMLISWASNGSKGLDVGDDPRMWRGAANG